MRLRMTSTRTEPSVDVPRHVAIMVMDLQATRWRLKIEEMECDE